MVAAEADAWRPPVVAVRHVVAAPVEPEAPGVERAADALALDDPAIADVRAHVRAVGVDDRRHPRFRTERHQVLPEQLQRHDVAGLQRGRLERQVPAGRVRAEWVPVLLHDEPPSGSLPAGAPMAATEVPRWWRQRRRMGVEMSQTEQATIARVPAGTDAGDVGDLLTRDGAVIVEDLIPPAVVDAVNAELEEYLQAAGEMKMYVPLLDGFHGAATRHVSGLAGKSRTFATEVMAAPDVPGAGGPVPALAPIRAPPAVPPDGSNWILNLGHMINRGPGADDQMSAPRRGDLGDDPLSASRRVDDRLGDRLRRLPSRERRDARGARQPPVGRPEHPHPGTTERTRREPDRPCRDGRRIGRDLPRQHVPRGLGEPDDR